MASVGKGGGGKKRGNNNIARLGKKYWERGEGGAEIGWGTPHDFYRCRDQLETHAHMSRGQASGYCAKRHKAATGKWPGQEGKKGKRGKK